MQTKDSHIEHDIRLSKSAANVPLLSVGNAYRHNMTAFLHTL